ncbi:MAG: hypothetical protein KGM47_09145 [Acidobacteriota bacterium]|nr:hypothetical protein [Acidobacteriota bacterium]
MKTTLVIPDPVFKDLKRQALDRGETISGLVTEYVVRGLREKPKRARLRPLPSFPMGWPPKVDIADRNALYDFLESERDKRLYRAKRKR